HRMEAYKAVLFLQKEENEPGDPNPQVAQTCSSLRIHAHCTGTICTLTTRRACTIGLLIAILLLLLSIGRWLIARLLIPTWLLIPALLTTVGISWRRGWVIPTVLRRWLIGVLGLVRIPTHDNVPLSFTEYKVSGQKVAFSHK